MIGSRETIAFVLLISSMLVASGPPLSAQATTPNILILQTYGTETVPYSNIASAFQSALVNNLGHSVNFDQMALDDDRFTGTAMQRAMADFLQRRSAIRKPDLVVTIGAPAAQFVTQCRDQISPGVPVVFVGADSRLVNPESLRQNATLITQSIHPAEWIEDIRQIAPNTTNLIFINGISPLEQFWMKTEQRELASVKGRMNLVFMSGMPLDQIEKAVSTLPPDSFIFLGIFIQDGAGITYAGNEPLQRIHKAANAPIFGLFQSQFGHGSIGGRLYQDRKLGILAAKAASRILKGESASSIQAQILQTPSPVYDWRELRRWGIPTSRLPAGSSIQFQTPSFWQHYRWRILGILSFFVIETLLIIGLLANRRKRQKVEKSLRQSEERYRGVFEAESDALFLIDHKEGRILDANPAAEKMYGYTRKEFLRLRSDEISAESEPFGQAGQAGLTKIPLRWHRHKDGGVFPVEISVGHLGDSGRRYSVAAMREISERIKAEERLRHSEQKYRKLHESMRDAFVHVDMTGKIVEFNPAYRQMLGHSEEELRQLTYVEITPEKWSDFEARIIREQVLLRGYSDVYEKEYRRRDGTVFPIEIRTFLITGEVGLPIGMWAIVRDITDRKRAEDALRQSEQNYRRLFDSITDAFLRTDMSGHIQEFNPAFRQMLGYGEQELRELSIFDLTPERWHAQEMEIFNEQILPRGSSRVYEKEYRRKDGTLFPVELRTYLMKDDQGEPCGMWAIIRDVSERKNAEAALRQRNHYIDTVLENAPIGFAVHTINDGVGRFVSRRFEEIYGVPRGSIDSYSTFFEKVWPRDPELREQIRSRVAADVESGEASRMYWENIPIPGPDGDTRYVTAMNIPLPDQNLMVSTVRDVTEQVRAEQAKRESETLLRLAAQAANFGAFSYNSTTNNLSCTPEVLNLFGLPPGTSLNLAGSVPDILHPEDKEKFLTQLRAAADPAGTGTLDLEYRIIRPDRQVRWFRSSGRIAFSEDGRPLRADGITQDITERKHVEEALRRSEERLRLAAAAAEFGVYSYNGATGQLFCSPDLLAIHGLPRGASLKLDSNLVPESVHPEDRNSFLANLRGSRKTGLLEFEYRILQPDGQVRWLRLRGRSVFSEKQLLRSEGVVQDITKQKHSEEARREIEDRFRNIAETISDFIWEVDAEGLYTYTSPSVEKILGYTPAEIVGKMHFYDLFSPDVRDQLKTSALQAFSYKQPFQSLPNSNVSKSGQIVYLETSGIPILDKSGRLLGYRGADTDVTERHRAETEKALLRDELALFSRIATINELTASIAHEINQPLAAILSNAQSGLRLMRGTAPDLNELREILEDIVSDNNRAAEVIRSLRAMLKHSGREHQRLELNPILHDVLSIVRHDAVARRIVISPELAVSLPAVSGERVQLQQVILNLIINAFEAMDPKGAIRELRLRTYECDKEVILDVIDSGRGIPSDKMDRIFDPFFSTKKTGLGMGLPLCKTIVSAHHGRIWAENNAGSGATFHIALPAQPPLNLDSEIEVRIPAVN